MSVGERLSAVCQARERLAKSKLELFSLLAGDLLGSVDNLADILAKCEADPDNMPIRSIFNVCLRECFEKAHELKVTMNSMEG